MSENIVYENRSLGYVEYIPQDRHCIEIRKTVSMLLENETESHLKELTRLGFISSYSKLTTTASFEASFSIIIELEVF